jgi:hypothetical protein
MSGTAWRIALYPGRPSPILSDQECILATLHNAISFRKIKIIKIEICTEY